MRTTRTANKWTSESSPSPRGRILSPSKVPSSSSYPSESPETRWSTSSPDAELGCTPSSCSCSSTMEDPLATSCMVSSSTTLCSLPWTSSSWWYSSFICGSQSRTLSRWESHSFCATHFCPFCLHWWLFRLQSGANRRPWSWWPTSTLCASCATTLWLWSLRSLWVKMCSIKW